MEKIKEEDLPLDQLKFYHLEPESLKKYSWWDKVLHGGKSPLIAIHFQDALGVEHWDSGKFRLSKTENGYDIKIDHVQSFLNLKKEFWKYNFSEEQQKQLFTDKELGEVITLEINGKKIPSLVGIDTDLNALGFMPIGSIYIPNQVKGCTVTDLEKFIMRRGGEVYKEDFKFDKNEKTTPAIMYFSAGLDKICFREPTPERLEKVAERNLSLKEEFIESIQKQEIAKNLKAANLDQTNTTKQSKGKHQTP